MGDGRAALKGGCAAGDRGALGGGAARGACRGAVKGVWVCFLGVPGTLLQAFWVYCTPPCTFWGTSVTMWCRLGQPRPLSVPSGAPPPPGRASRPRGEGGRPLPGPRTPAQTPARSPAGRALFGASLHGAPAWPEPQAPQPAGGSSSGQGRAAPAPGRALRTPTRPGTGLPQGPPARQRLRAEGRVWHGPCLAPGTVADLRRVPRASPASPGPAPHLQPLQQP